MKTMIAVCSLLILSLGASAQKLGAAKVPKAVKDAFAKSHPGVTASWEREAADYEANFKEGGKTMSCILTKQGTIIETETGIRAEELPASAKTYMNQHYKGQPWKEVAKIDKADGTVNYEVEIKGKDVLFDANGQHIMKKKEAKEKD